MHLSEEEFWALEPRQFWALLERKEQGDIAKDQRAAVIAATVANCLAKGSHKIKDFMPRRKPKQQSVDEQLAVLKGMI